MSYYARGQDDVADFDEYDSTPYSGGYDIRLTYGHPLSPSDNICYPPSTTSRQCDTVVDSDRPTYSSSSQPSAYAGDALDNEYRSYSRPRPRPRPPPPSYGGPPEYGFGPPPPGPPPPGPPPPGPPPPEFEMGRPNYRGGEFGGPGPEFGSGFGRPDQEYGSREYDKPRHGHKKHGGDDDSSDDNSDDSDEEKKQRRHGRRHQHHHHGGYDD